MSHVPDTAFSRQAKPGQPCALALDIGTSSVRAALYDTVGNQIEESYVKHERAVQTTSDGGALLDANEALAQVERALDAVLARSPSLTAEQVELVGLSCFWHSLVGIASDGSALTPLLTWADTRAAPLVEELRRLSDEGETHRRTGCRFHASYWPAKLLWLRRESADAFQRVARWMSFSDLVFERFFGETETSVSMASATGLFDQHALVWDAELLRLLGLAVEKLPRIAAPGKTFSGLRAEYARRWPQLGGARWSAAIGDGAANNIGAGCATRERAALMIGTSGALRVLWQGDAPATLPPELWCYRADDRRVITGGALSDGGGLYQWMNESLRLIENDEELERALGTLEPDAHGLTVLPFWSGERSTGWHASARGAILGLSAHTQPLEIMRAAMEAVAYRFALILRALDAVAPQALLIASGGALRASPVWTQVMADVLGRPLTLSAAREASSRGAVLLALEMAGKIKSVADVPTELGQTFRPDAARHERYRVGLERQQKFYRQLITFTTNSEDTETT
ncbi:MAG: gluconokinase [Acidobacteria bacterium]|nr:gluconokinase [Acidobacteriota bacterium]